MARETSDDGNRRTLVIASPSGSGCLGDAVGCPMVRLDPRVEALPLLAMEGVEIQSPKS
ncbi:MAG: hypothetical protein HN494_14905 [Opitutae bacterium]|nr:hypothetical protein [Opitutae bacterium]